MDWRKAVCAVDMMHVHMHVLLRPAPDECVLFHAARIRLLQLLAQHAHILYLVSLRNCTPSPSVHVLIYTPSPESPPSRCPAAAFFSSVSVSFSHTWSLQLFFSFPLQASTPPPQSLMRIRCCFFTLSLHYLFICSPLICCLGVEIAPMSKEKDVGSPGQQMEIMFPLRFSERAVMQTEYPY